MIRLPGVFTAATESKGFKSHGFEGYVAGEDHEVCPGNLTAVFLFDGPEQSAGFVQTGVVWPAVERGKALLSSTAAAASIASPVGASTVPCHADEKRAVVAIVSGPPFL